MFTNSNLKVVILKNLKVIKVNIVKAIIMYYEPFYFYAFG